MAFCGGDLEKWQAAAREKLVSLLGLPFEKCPDEFRIEYVKKEEKYTETRFVFQSEDGYFVPCHFIEPVEKEKDCPVVICLQGHSTGMHISLGRVKFEGDEKSFEGQRDFAPQCVEMGWCAVAIEQRCFGEMGGNPRPQCHETAMTALLTGRTLLGERVWDISRLIDVLLTHFGGAFDKNKIYCVGNSGGGTAIFYAAALEERISAAVPSCSFCTYLNSIGEKHHCACNYVPGIANYFDMADIAGMIAPRPLVIVSGVEDGIFPLEGASSEFCRLKNTYYAAAGAENRLRHVIGPAGHRFYAEPAWAALKEVTEQ